MKTVERCVFALVLAMSAVGWSNAAPVASVLSRPPDPQLGDVFLWQRKLSSPSRPPSVYHYRSLISAVAPDGSFEETYESQGNDGTYSPAWVESYDAQARYLQNLDFNDGSVCSYTPAHEAISFPAFVGKTWSNNFDYACPEFVYETSERRRVGAFERISTPAGDFEALRIEAKGVRVEDGLFVTDVDEACWWAVRPGKFVKCKTTFTPRDNPDSFHTDAWVVTGISRP